VTARAGGDAVVQRAPREATPLAGLFAVTMQPDDTSEVDIPTTLCPAADASFAAAAQPGA
jgi:hypothetical protein